ncbi:MAG: polyprenyl synthetase family protein [Clostridia bacterium]|nr:polyprenyl synthetase family protein [Clostridia bacterium]
MFKNILSEYSQRAEEAVLSFFPEEETAYKTVLDSMRYSVSAGGKRLRPVIMMMCAKMISLPEKEVMPFAAALEMIHTYSLIHDDLPSMDNDDLRRGKPTNHKVFGEAMAILAGDGLLNKAAETVSEAEYSVDYKNVVKAINELFKASGADGMIGGQVMDIESEGKRVELSYLQNIHRLKTGALLKAAGVIPCVLKGENSDMLKAVISYTENLGIAFQITDDLLDVYGTTEELGKNTGSDEKAKKSTYVSLLGKEKSEELVLKHTQDAIEALSIFKGKAEELIALAKYLTERRN